MSVDASGAYAFVPSYDPPPPPPATIKGSVSESVKNTKEPPPPPELYACPLEGPSGFDVETGRPF